MSTSEEILKALNWRYATKAYDPSKKLSIEQLQTIKDLMRLSPSSSGLQAWKFVHIGHNLELRKELRAAGYNQQQFEQASDIMVFAAYENLSAEHIEKIVKNAALVQGKTEAEIEPFRQYLQGVLKMHADPEIAKVNLSRQVYIALGLALTTAALLGVDATPMEGFDKAKFDQILGLDKQGLHSYVVLALGFRSPDDTYQLQKKVRFPESELFIEK